MNVVFDIIATKKNPVYLLDLLRVMNNLEAINYKSIANGSVKDVFWLAVCPDLVISLLDLIFVVQLSVADSTHI